MERLQKACRYLQENDFEHVGKCMFETHEGLRDQYEVSCPELDLLVDMVKDRPEVPGARMMGGGFGGCTINLVRAGEAEILAAEIAVRYQEATNTPLRSEEHTSELQSLMRISYAVFCLKKKHKTT